MRLLRPLLAPSLVVAAALPLLACTSTSGGGGTGAGTTVTETACDPLAAKPITLGKVVGVGKDAAGTLHVDAENGIFVSGGGKLLRQHVVGTGQSGNDEYIFSYVAPGASADGATNLLVETTGDTASAMALGPDGKTFLNQNPPGATALTLVDPSTLAGMALVNTPGVIEYLADVSNGDVLLATIPMNEDYASPNGGLAIFYGPKGAVAQRTITALDQSHSGGGTLTFLVDGTPYLLAFGNAYDPDAGPLGAFTLMGLTPQGGAELGTTLRSPTPTTLPTDLSFTCMP